MLLILGSAYDAQPWRLAERWMQAERDVAVATPSDLSRPGWRLRVGRPTLTRAAVGERVIAGHSIDAAINALAWIGPHDLAHVDSMDRDYVAQEMLSFLLAWEQELRCLVVDRPTSRSLTGCGRTDLEWVAIATCVGVDTDVSWAGPSAAVTVVGGSAIVEQGSVSLANAAEAMARAAQRSLVTLRFSSGSRPVFVGAEARPEVGHDDVAFALLEWLERS